MQEQNFAKQRLPRLYLSPDQFSTDGVSLRKEDLHYLKRVLRRKSGDQFAALDGKSRAWICELSDQAQANYREEYPAVKSSSRRLTVGLSLCKGSRFEEALEMLSELGVTSVIPLLTERTERKLPSESKQKRWKAIVDSASVLAYRLTPLKMHQPTALKNFPFQGREKTCFCHPDGESAAEYFRECSPELSLLIGPEGGFSAEETSFLEMRASKLNLGPLNLRVATAAVVASSLALQG